jgi:hypothetical protein
MVGLERVLALVRGPGHRQMTARSQPGYFTRNCITVPAP